MNEIPLLDLVLEEEFAADDRLVYLATTPPAPLQERFGCSRVRTFPISEPAMVGMAVGLAMTGWRPVVDLNRASFQHLVLDQVVNHAAVMHYLSGGQYQVPMVVSCATRDNLQLGPQHEQCPYGMAMQIPGISVAVPSGLTEACGLLRAALRRAEPVLLFVAPTFAEQSGMKAALAAPPMPFGRAARLREGTHATVVAVGTAVATARTAVERLAANGIECDLFDPRTLTPLDVAALGGSARRTGRLVIVDDGPRNGAPTGILGALASVDGVLAALGGRVRLVAAPNVPIPASPVLESLISPTVAQVVAAVRELVGPGPSVPNGARQPVPAGEEI